MAGQRSRIRYHCRACRRAGKSNPWFTLRVGAKRIKCTRCRSDDVYSQHQAQQRAEQARLHLRCRELTCRVPHPHRVGTHKLCVKYPHYVSDEELQEIETKLYTQYPNRTSTT